MEEAPVHGGGEEVMRVPVIMGVLVSLAA
jgi:hypothetical protein